MITLQPFIGHEHRMDELARAIRAQAQSYRAPMVGAMQLTCCDESEYECMQAFQQGVVAELLPPLKFGKRSCFRVASAGAHYEWGSIRIAEQHFATQPARDAFKVMVVKVNSHVSIDEGPAEPRFGMLQRYNEDSQFCGALHVLLNEGDALPFAKDLAEAFQSEGMDRLAMLNDPAVVPAEYRSLFVAITSARLQARRVILDIQDYTPFSPTVFLVLPCVTLNRPQLDTEILCGMYEADDREGVSKVTYVGLCDDPSTYTYARHNRAISVVSQSMDHPRAARDHRQLVADAPTMAPTVEAPRWQDLVAKVQSGVTHQHSKQLLEAAVLILGEVAPIPAAMVLFGTGFSGIYNVYRAHRLVSGRGDKEDAQVIIEDVQNRMKHLSPEQAHAALEALTKHFGPG